jgi:hypothetical protein
MDDVFLFWKGEGTLLTGAAVYTASQNHGTCSALPIWTSITSTWDGDDFHRPPCPCLFQFFGASGHQKLLWTAKHSVFQSAFIKFVWLKTIQNQHKHIIGLVIAIVGICHFLYSESYGHLYLPPHVILMILRFSKQPDSPHSQILRKAGQKKAEPNKPHVSRLTQQHSFSNSCPTFVALACTFVRTCSVIFNSYEL